MYWRSAGIVASSTSGTVISRGDGRSLFPIGRYPLRQISYRLTLSVYQSALRIQEQEILLRLIEAESKSDPCCAFPDRADKSKSKNERASVQRGS
jgi:hypothetical protein